MKVNTHITQSPANQSIKHPQNLNNNILYSIIVLLILIIFSLGGCVIFLLINRPCITQTSMINKLNLTKLKRSPTSVLPSNSTAKKIINSSPLELLSLTNSEVLYPGQTYKILWKNDNLIQWGDKIIICFIGFDHNDKEIPAKKEWNDPRCTYPQVDKGSYLIKETKLSSGSHTWIIPRDILNLYTIQPTRFKIRILVFDEQPVEGKTNWEGNVGHDESIDYLTIENRF